MDTEHKLTINLHSPSVGFEITGLEWECYCGRYRQLSQDEICNEEFTCDNCGIRITYEPHFAWMMYFEAGFPDNSGGKTKKSEEVWRVYREN